MIFNIQAAYGITPVHLFVFNRAKYEGLFLGGLGRVQNTSDARQKELYPRYFLNLLTSYLLNISGCGLNYHTNEYLTKLIKLSNHKELK